MKGLHRVTCMVLLIMMFSSMMCLSAFAITPTQDEQDYLAEHITDNWVKNYLATEKPTGVKSPERITIGGDEYYLVNGKSSDDLYNYVSMKVKSNNVTDKTQDITSGGSGGIKIEANTGEASNMLSGFVPVVNIILGVVTVGITLGLALYTAFDICYIVFPVFRNKCEDDKVNGNGRMVKTSNNGETKLRWVSDEAQYVVRNCSIESGKSPLSSYLTKRIGAYVGVTIVLFILLTGNISIITNIVLKFVSGIVDVLQGLA